MKIYITKKKPHHYTFAGADRIDVWFSKPILSEDLCICPVFGLLEQKEFEYAQWHADDGISLKILRKTKSALFDKIWRDIQATYVDPCYIAVSENYAKARTEFDKIHKMPIYGNTDATPLAKALAFHTDLKRTIFCEQSVEKVSWREWIGEYDIEMTLE